jgi:hypothetical protein
MMQESKRMGELQNPRIGIRTGTIIALLLAGCCLTAGCSSRKSETTPPRSDTLQVPSHPAEATLSGSDLQRFIVHSGIDTSDLQLISETCVVEMPPMTEERTGAATDSLDEDTATALDDYYAYFSDVIHQTTPLNISLVRGVHRYIRFAIADTLAIVVDTRQSEGSTWNPFLFKRGKYPEIYDLTGNADTTRIARYFQ